MEFLVWNQLCFSLWDISTMTMLRYEVKQESTMICTISTNTMFKLYIVLIKDYYMLSIMILLYLRLYRLLL